jgi:hypothetical protein
LRRRTPYNAAVVPIAAVLAHQLVQVALFAACSKRKLGTSIVRLRNGALPLTRSGI